MRRPRFVSYETVMRLTAVSAVALVSACFCLECLQSGDMPDGGADDAGAADLAMPAPRPDGAPPDGAPPAGDLAAPACQDVSKAPAVGKALKCYGKFGGLGPTPDDFCKVKAGATCTPCADGSQVDAAKCEASDGFAGSKFIGDRKGATVTCAAGSGTTLVAGCGGRTSASIKPGLSKPGAAEIGRASCRERVSSPV